MRPKKVILLLDDDETARCVRTTVLETRGYRVLAAATADEARAYLGHQQVPDIMLARLEIGNAGAVARDLHAVGIPSLIFTDRRRSCPIDLQADGFLPKGTATPIEVLERLRILVARKRGPKPPAAVRPAAPTAEVPA